MSDGFIIRQATPEDAAALSAIATQTFVDHVAKLFNPPDISPLYSLYPEHKMREELLDPAQQTFFISPASDLQTPCGYSTIIDGSIRPGEDGAVKDYMEIKRVYIHKDFHGKGAAYKLMEAVLQAVHAKRRKFVWLATSPKNVRALKFYDKYGFVVTGEKPFNDGSGFEPDLVLTLQAPEAQ